jgi:hypothetical protein
MPLNSLRRFLGVFVALFVLLELPWPGLEAGSRRLFQALTRTVLCTNTARREVTLETLPPSEHEQNDTRLVIVNPQLMTPAGAGPVRNLDFDSRRLAWNPTALFLALMLATPRLQRGRAQLIAVGLAVIHTYALMVLTFAVWNESAALSLVTLPTGWQPAVNGLKQALINQLPLAVPVMAWAVAAWRFAQRSDSMANPGSSAARNSVATPH